MLDDLLMILWPGGHPELLARRRALAVVRRVRGIALLFAVLTTAWIGVDAAVFEPAIWQRLAAIRVAAALALFALAHACALAAPTLLQAGVRLALLFAIASLFFFASLDILRHVARDDLTRGIAAAYSFMPLMLAAGLGAFALTAAESAALLTFALATQMWSMGGEVRLLAPYGWWDGLWLLMLIASVGAFAAASQLKLLCALVLQSMRDPLTGCLRREIGGELLEMQFSLALRRKDPLTVVFADIDRFKSVNDQFGHEAGDRVLASVAQSLRAVLRASDVLVRWGGEEFVVILPQTGHTETASLIERMRVGGFGLLPDGRAVTLSLGIAEPITEAIASTAELVARADERMYQAKQAGRNRYVDGLGQAQALLPAPPVNPLLARGSRAGDASSAP